jgi:hypothetical protein
MGRVKLTSRNLNRYTKVYPYVRAQPRYAYFTNEEFVLESATINFEGNNTATYTFTNSYTAVPTVIATSLNDSFNVFVSSVTTTQVVIGASIPNSDSASIVVVTT